LPEVRHESGRENRERQIDLIDNNNRILDSSVDFKYHLSYLLHSKRMGVYKGMELKEEINA